MPKKVKLYFIFKDTMIGTAIEIIAVSILVLVSGAIGVLLYL